MLHWKVELCHPDTFLCLQGKDDITLTVRPLDDTVVQRVGWLTCASLAYVSQMSTRAEEESKSLSVVTRDLDAE